MRPVTRLGCVLQWCTCYNHAVDTATTCDVEKDGFTVASASTGSLVATSVVLEVVFFMAAALLA